MLPQRGLTALFSALCLVLRLGWGEGLRIAVIPDPQEEVINPLAHELAAYAAGLGGLKHNVTLLPDLEDDEKTLDGLLGSSNKIEDAYYDAVLTQGECSCHTSPRHTWPQKSAVSCMPHSTVRSQKTHSGCLQALRLEDVASARGNCMPPLAVLACTLPLSRAACSAGTKASLIADYAARLHIPVIRFISKGTAVGATAPHPLYERPAALVFATEEDEHAFDVDHLAEALRLVISPAKCVSISCKHTLRCGHQLPPLACQ